jgi:hypothetical protein
MLRNWCAIAVAGGILAGSGNMDGAQAQKAGGILKMFNPDSPASMSIHEESTAFAQRPMMAVFNNLVMFDQNVKQNISIGCAGSGDRLVWNEGTELTPLHRGVNGTTGSPLPP